MPPDRIITRLDRIVDDVRDAAANVDFDDDDTIGELNAIADDLRALRLEIERETLCTRSAAA